MNETMFAMRSKKKATKKTARHAKKTAKKIFRSKPQKKIKGAAKPKILKKTKPVALKNKKLKVAKLSIEGLSYRDAAAAICGQLEACGFDPILVGKSCAAIYSTKIMKPDCIEFVISEYMVDEIEMVMKSLGYSHIGHRTYSGKKTPFQVSFQPPPICVGDNIVDSTGSIKTQKGMLKLLSPTDCARQRLAAYYRFGEPDALDDAVAVAMSHTLDMKLIEKWSHWEWASDKFNEFVSKIKSQQG